MSVTPPTPVAPVLPTTTPPPAAEPPKGDPAEPKSFSEADVNRLVQERLARQKAQFDGFDDYKAKATQFDELQAANATELERATARAEAAEKKAADAIARSETTARRSAIIAAASAAGAVDATTVAKLIDGSTLAIDADGSVTGATEAVAALLEASPFLKGTNGTTPVPTKPTPGFDGGARPGATSVTVDQLRSMTPAQVAALDPKVVEAALKTG